MDLFWSKSITQTNQECAGNAAHRTISEDPVQITTALTATSLATLPTHAKNELDARYAKQKTISRPGNWGRRTRAQRTPNRIDEPPEVQPELAQHDQEPIYEDGDSSQAHSIDSEGSSGDEGTDDNMHDGEEGVSDIEQFSSSEESNASPSQRKWGARPEEHVKKKSFRICI